MNQRIKMMTEYFDQILAANAERESLKEYRYAGND
jgi:hypothetical protein